jgi:hypothetical protein
VAVPARSVDRLAFRKGPESLENTHQLALVGAQLCQGIPRAARVISQLQVPLERFLCEAQQLAALVAVEAALDLLRQIEQARNEGRVVRCAACVLSEALLQLCAHAAVRMQSMCPTHMAGRPAARSGVCAARCRLLACAPAHCRPGSG